MLEIKTFWMQTRFRLLAWIFLADSTISTSVLCCFNSEDLNGVLPILKTYFKLGEDLDLSVRELIQIFRTVTVDIPGKINRWEKVFKIETGLELLGQPVFSSVILSGSNVWVIEEFCFIKSNPPTAGKNRHLKINSSNWARSREKALLRIVEAKESVKSFHDIGFHSACIYPARRPKQKCFTKMRLHKKGGSCIMSIPFVSYIHSRLFPPRE